MIKQFNYDKDPNKIVTLLYAINWTVYALNNYVQQTTIANCQYKSTLVAKLMLSSDINAYSEANNLKYLAEMQREEEIRANLQSRIL